MPGIWRQKLDCQMGFIRSDEAGAFLAFLVDRGNDMKNMRAINGSSAGTISLKELSRTARERSAGAEAGFSIF